MFCEEAVAGLLSFINMPAFNLHLPCDVLVLDAGGGTVDLFQCKILANKDVAEVTQADGGFFGSTLVDRYFWDFIKNTIGPQAYNELWNNPTLRTSKIDFINIWDGIKRSFDENESEWADEMMGGYKHINLSWELSKAIPQHIFDSLPSSGEIRLQKHHLKSFFDPAVQEITKMVINQLDASGKTSYNQLDALVMIGGFCNNRYLRDTILKHPKIAPRVKSVANIPEPDSVVVRGASWYAFDRGFVSERKSRFTLGIRVLRPFNPQKDRQIDVVNRNDPVSEWIVNRGFREFVQIGDSIYHGSAYMHTVQFFKGSLIAKIEILKSDKSKNVTDTDEDGVSIAGQFNLDFGELELWIKLLPILKFGEFMSEKELESVAIRTTMKIAEDFAHLRMNKLELDLASQPRSNLSEIPLSSASRSNDLRNIEVVRQLDDLSQSHTDTDVVIFELCVNETVERKKQHFNRFVMATMDVCHLPLFKAAFLSTIIFEFLYPISKQPYLDTKNAALEEELWTVFVKLNNVVQVRNEENFEMRLAEVSQLLDGFEYIVKKGSMESKTKISVSKVGKAVANAFKSVFGRNPKMFGAGAAAFTGIHVTKETDDYRCPTDTIDLTKAKCSENGVRESDAGYAPTPLAESFNDSHSYLSNWSSGSKSVNSNASKFDHLESNFRNKVLGLKRDVFPNSQNPCKQRFSYKREPMSEVVRDWVTIALQQIENRRPTTRRQRHWFVDADCLVGGQLFTRDFLDALLHTKVVFLLITEDTLSKFNFDGDNVLLEWEWALHLSSLHSPGKFRIQPIFIGSVDTQNETFKAFNFNALERLHLDTLTMTHPHEQSPRERSLREVIKTIFNTQGSKVFFERRSVINEISALVEGHKIIE
ncbi:Heat shock 70 kDa protein 12A [Nowakowskiella sp. JEL0407]|nr:Heat shock 70 kDa protein 12A [Nowakowskiella sp. JEL0407]